MRHAPSCGVPPGSHEVFRDTEMCGVVLRPSSRARHALSGETGEGRWYRDQVRIAGLLLSGRDETLF
jgi:hypothetical protein